MVAYCDGLPTLRLRDLLAKQDPSRGYLLSHWRDWPDEYTDTFWRICGEQMERHDYAPNP